MTKGNQGFNEGNGLTWDFRAFLAVSIRPNPCHPWFGLSLYPQLNTQVKK